MDNRESALTAQFGRFILNSRRRELLADGVPVPIGGRAFDILAVLVEAGGQLVTKDELLSRVWPGRFVEENSLQFQISTVRKALAPDGDFIKTICGRGYRFIADISTPTDRDAASIMPRGESPPAPAFRAAMSDLIGQEAQLAGLADLFTACGLATLVNASGIGETRAATEAGRLSLTELANEAWAAAPGSSAPESAASAATVRKLAEHGPAALQAIIAALAPIRLLLLLSIGNRGVAS